MNKNLLLCAICAFVLGFVSTPTTANDFTLAATATLRGGCIDYRADECTADFRYYSYGYPSNESAFFGFRLACPTK